MAHPYAEDFDLFGKGSLFELLSTARTRGGEDTLAQWLLHPAASEVVIERQAAVEELRTKLDLREDLALLGEDVRSQTHPDKLIAWAEAPPVLTSGGARAVAAVLSLAMLAVGAYWAWEQLWEAATILRAALITLLAINTAFGLSFRQRVLAFALAYADVVQRDHRRFVGARAELDAVEAWVDAKE